MVRQPKPYLLNALREKPFLRVFEQAWVLQTSQGGHIHAENPVGSLAWKDLDLGPAYEADFHMCAVGMKCVDTGLPIFKPTRVVTSDSGLAVALRRHQCKGDHEHTHLEGSKKTRRAETYPKFFCKVVASYFASRDKLVTPTHDIFLNSDDEADSERESDPEGPANEPDRQDPERPRRVNYPAMIQKLHTNTGHASIPQMLRLAQRVRAPAAVIEAIKQFRCPICEELQAPPSHRVAALRHTEVPNQIVGVDVVQVELKKDGPDGMEELKFNVTTVVDYASDFAQQIVLPAGSGVVSQAFHSVWRRPYGPPKVIYVDPDQRWMSGDFQKYLRQNSITLLDRAAESHWQLGRVEIAQKILRRMAQRIWRTTERPPVEVIESCCAIRNEQLKRHGFSSAQWFLGREPRVPGSLADLEEQRNDAVQDAVVHEQDFGQKMRLRQQAAEAFVEAHAHNVWKRAIRGRNRPIRGPYIVGQSVYLFRRQSRGLLSTRHGVWIGPGRVVGTESFRPDSPIPGVVWVVVNGFMYKCSPESLRPVADDKVAFRQLAQQFHSGLEHVSPARRGPAGRFFDVTQEVLCDEDFFTPPASDEEGAPAGASPSNARNVRRRVSLDDSYWEARAQGVSPRGASQVRKLHPDAEVEGSPSPKARRTEQEDDISDIPPDFLTDAKNLLPSPEALASQEGGSGQSPEAAEATGAK